MLRLIKKLEKKQWLLLFIVFILVFAQVMLELKMPDYMFEVTKLVQTPGTNLGDIWQNGLYMLLCALGSVFIAFVSSYFIAYVTSKFSFNLTRDLFNKIQAMSFENIERFSTSSLITRTTNDISQIEMFLGMGLMIFMRSPIMAVLAISKILDKGFEWSLATAIAVGILLTVITLLSIIVIPKFKIIQKLTDKLNNVTRENLTGIRVVRAFNAEKYQEVKIKDVNEKLTSLHKFTQKSFGTLMPIMNIVLYGLTLVIYLIGANMIANAAFVDKINIFGNMIVFSSYAMQVIFSFLMMAFLLVNYSRAQVSSDRINEVLNTKETLLEGSFDSETEKHGEIEFRDVSFKYPDAEEYILEDISFSVKQGENIAIIGMTGSGKSTLVNLIPRFYEVTEGEILVDGVNVKDYTFANLYNKIGYVSQRAVMFNMPIKDNIAFGEAKEDIDEEDVVRAAKISQADEFISKMDNQYDSMISRGGTNISGGQKQRLSIARAIARKPEIFIFDDTFSALDFKTESVLRKELEENLKESTSIVVASRVGSIMNSDKIILLEKGRIVGMGTHKELWLNNQLYREIALSQLSEEELNESIK
ncbi:ABC transporter ATP-binding protein [Helcococcus kunzii]|uniref:ABC transporter ATP-binding protein n=1 Tax=Helcococcus kunzii ATCC 51366 TaxID=883114 RepID=H3NNR9_9FIRM|nr:ABC transporter ATP-binding protein [Helcococcus kunzii]EHR34044.1 hypothetical protein HMPREF9709_00980 [Helcococcus kunzii ATCC 51366]QUY64892.1 ABC transporter ATP-binding protein [Helcococcus kunzii]